MTVGGNVTSRSINNVYQNTFQSIAYSWRWGSTGWGEVEGSTLLADSSVSVLDLLPIWTVRYTQRLKRRKSRGVAQPGPLDPAPVPTYTHRSKEKTYP